MVISLVQNVNECTNYKGLLPVKYKRNEASNPYKGDLQMIIGYQKENKGFKIQKVPRKWYLKQESATSTKALIEMDTTSHEVILIPYHIHTWS
jgi:hypothetical protein